MAGLADESPIFILSYPRSGSTVLRYLLDAHPEICCPAEVRLGATVQTLLTLLELTAAGGDGAEAEPSERAHKVRGILDTVFAEYCARKGKKRWCEKSPININFIRQVVMVYPDAQYICLHRHPLDVVVSMLDVEGPCPDFMVGQVRRWGGDGVAAHIERWCSQTETLLAFEHAFADRTIRLNYERLVDDPESELGRVLSFLKVEVLAGLATAAFTAKHDPGPGDVKIRSTANIRADRIGRGRAIDSAKVPADLLRRLLSIAAKVGYEEESVRGKARVAAVGEGIAVASAERRGVGSERDFEVSRRAWGPTTRPQSGPDAGA